MESCHVCFTSCCVLLLRMSAGVSLLLCSLVTRQQILLFCFARRQQGELTVAEGGVVCSVFLKDQGDIFTSVGPTNCPKPKDIQCSLIDNTEKQQILTLEELELAKVDLKKNIFYFKTKLMIKIDNYFNKLIQLCSVSPLLSLMSFIFTQHSASVTTYFQTICYCCDHFRTAQTRLMRSFTCVCF